MREPPTAPARPTMRQVRRRAGRPGTRACPPLSARSVRRPRSPRRDASRESRSTDARSQRTLELCEGTGAGHVRDSLPIARRARQRGALGRWQRLRRGGREQPLADHSRKRASEENQQFTAVARVEAELRTLSSASKPTGSGASQSTMISASARISSHAGQNSGWPRSTVAFRTLRPERSPGAGLRHRPLDADPSARKPSSPTISDNADRVDAQNSGHSCVDDVEQFVDARPPIAAITARWIEATEPMAARERNQI